MKKSTQKLMEKPTVGKWLINKVNTKDYRSGKVTGKKHPKKSEIIEGLGELIGREKIITQIRSLEKEGIIEVEWTSVNSDFKKISFSLENMPALCKYEKVMEPRQELDLLRECVNKYKNTTDSKWLSGYYDECLNTINKGNLTENARDENIFKILNKICKLDQDIWKRKFSADTLGTSKLFEKHYEDRIITILRDYSPYVVDAMTKDEILSEHHIHTYSQILELKGSFQYTINDKLSGKKTIVDTTNMFYGTMLNAQTIISSDPLSAQNVKKVITIENKANYEEMKHNPEILYIFTHGFLSPKERVFLKKLVEIIDSDAEFYHWGDLDYGGIRIFQFLKKEIFFQLKPLYMSKNDYLAALEKGAGIAVSEEKLKKISDMDAGELDELKQCILQHKLEIEQENFI